MALREFTDEGVEWKVWDVAPEEMHPVTAAEDFLADMLSGWLCFESARGRRRLAPYPNYWDRMSDEELKLLLKRATPVVSRVRSLGMKSPEDPRREL
ncbi:MAG: hypothetical protein H7Z74_18390 [Anaerolineae bacterium]|nr:hypothetical protein [Gemmatimonadaceae bacterium]